MPFKLSRILEIFLNQLSAHHAILFTTSLLALTLLPWMSKEFNRIVPLLVVWSISDILAIFSAIIFKNNSPVFHAYALIGLLLLLTYYYPQLKDLPHMRSVFFIGVLGYGIIWGLNLMFFQPLLILPSNAIMFASVLILFFVLTSFKYMLDHPIETSLFLQPRFWVNTGILIFYSSTFFYFFVHTYLHKIGQYPSFLKPVLVIPNIIWVICLAIGLFCDLGVFSIKKRIHDRN